MGVAEISAVNVDTVSFNLCSLLCIGSCHVITQGTGQDGGVLKSLLVQKFPYRGPGPLSLSYSSKSLYPCLLVNLCEDMWIPIPWQHCEWMLFWLKANSFKSFTEFIWAQPVTPGTPSLSRDSWVFWRWKVDADAPGVESPLQECSCLVLKMRTLGPRKWKDPSDITMETIRVKMRAQL